MTFLQISRGFYLETGTPATFHSANGRHFLTKFFGKNQFFSEHPCMAVPSMPEDNPIKPGAVASAGDAAEEREDLETPTGDGGEDDAESEVIAESLTKADIEAINAVVSQNDDDRLVASKIIPAERGYTIEQLQNNEEGAWNKAIERYLKIAVHKYRDLVSFYLPGVGEDDAKSAVGDIVPDLCEKISKYPSLPQLDAAFRTALSRKVWSLQRKFLTKKRGEGKIDVSSELHGLGLQDAPIDQRTYKDEDKPSPSPKNSAKTLEDKVNREYGGWSSLKSGEAIESANRVDQKKLLSEAMDELEPDERQIIEWSILDQLKQREIAKKLGVTTSSIGVRIIRTKKKLKQLVHEKTLNEKKEFL